jgi:hypothetical protein
MCLILSVPRQTVDRIIRLDYPSGFINIEKSSKTYHKYSSRQLAYSGDISFQIGHVRVNLVKRMVTRDIYYDFQRLAYENNFLLRKGRKTNTTTLRNSFPF